MIAEAGNGSFLTNLELKKAFKKNIQLHNNNLQDLLALLVEFLRKKLRL